MFLDVRDAGQKAAKITIAILSLAPGMLVWLLSMGVIHKLCGAGHK